MRKESNFDNPIAIGLATILAMVSPALAAEPAATGDQGEQIWSECAAPKDSVAKTCYYLGAANEADLLSFNTGPIDNAVTWPVAGNRSDQQPVDEAVAEKRYYLGAASEAELRAFNTGPIDNAPTWPVADEAVDGVAETADDIPNQAASGAPKPHPYWTGPSEPHGGEKGVVDANN